jgi:hypothetical protein
VDDDAPTLWHYTCDHGLAGIGKPYGWARPFSDGVVWLTDLDAPVPDALGLTSHLLTCDRTAHRYRVVDAWAASPWMEMRPYWDPVRRDALEAAPGAMPRHWWVSPVPVRVRLDERRGVRRSA